MKFRFRTLLLAGVAAAPLLAGALTLQIADPSSDPEAMARHAAILARITACRSPEKTSVQATAEGMTEGKRVSVPLHVQALNTPGTFAVTHEWPREGRWVVRFTATNPDYKSYATGVLVPANGESFDWSRARHVYHAPTEQEVTEALAVD